MTAPADLFRYSAVVLDWHDGDTCHVDLDLGFHLHLHASLRCAGYNAPEIHGPSAAAGNAATDFVKALVPVGTTLLLDSLGFAKRGNFDDFGRVLALVTLPDGRDLAAVMIAAGQAVPDPA